MDKALKLALRDIMEINKEMIEAVEHLKKAQDRLNYFYKVLGEEE